MIFTYQNSCLLIQFPLLLLCTTAYVHLVHTNLGLVDVCFDVDCMYCRPLNRGTSTIQRYVSVQDSQRSNTSLPAWFSSSMLHSCLVNSSTSSLQFPGPSYLVMGVPHTQTWCTYRYLPNAFSIFGSLRRLLDGIGHSQNLTKHRNKKGHLVFHDPKHKEILTPFI